MSHIYIYIYDDDDDDDDIKCENNYFQRLNKVIVWLLTVDEFD